MTIKTFEYSIGDTTLSNFSRGLYLNPLHGKMAQGFQLHHPLGGVDTHPNLYYDQGVKPTLTEMWHLISFSLGAQSALAILKVMGILPWPWLSILTPGILSGAIFIVACIIGYVLLSFLS